MRLWHDRLTVRTLVMQFHPLDDSYNVALLNAVVDGLEESGRPHEVVRLAQGGVVDRERLMTTGHLIVVTPTWWGAMPAKILDWIQSELGPWIDGGQDPARSPLRSVERLTVVTSHGSSRLMNGVQGEPGRKLWRRSVLPLCAPSARFDWLSLYKIDRSDEAGRQAFVDRVGREIRAMVATA
jgi:putative NADPH-quinone reductase